MTDDTTARLNLPFLQAGQAQKELTHNEALALLDIAVQPNVEAIGTTIPPTAPLVGQCWVLGAQPTGAWTGQARALAGWTAGGWRFVPPVEGLSVWSRNDLCTARYSGGDWQIGVVPTRRVTVGGVQVVGARQPAVAAPAGGAVIDIVARQSIAGIITALQQHGLISTP
jgi:hypothetical protein